MPRLIPHVTMDPHVRLPSTWKGDPRLGYLTDAQIRRYERAGYYGPEAQERRRKLDATKVVHGELRIPKDCECCHKGLGHFMTFSYLPKSGYYCNACREDYRDEHDKQAANRKRARTLEAFE